MEIFGKDENGDDMVYYVEMNEHNRPFKVKRKSAGNGEEQSVFIDDDPTHYIDIHVSKDGNFLFINSGTKEDSEIWVIQDFEPKLLIPRIKDVRVHIEHLRDFFLIITNNN